MPRSPQVKTNVNKIEVCRIRVQPLAYWKCQRSKQKPVLQDWPRSSTALCWYCCHAFTDVPVYLPVECDLAKNIFVFTGNFCSWNCCKQYACEMKTPPPGAVYIGLLSYLTCHRGMFCHEPEHDLGLCECLDEYKGIVRPLPKENLAAFGGRLSIQEYRQDFLVIRSYASIDTNFTTNESILATFRRVQKLRGRDEAAAWGFEYIKFPPPPDYVVEYVQVLPLSGKVMRENDTPMVLTGNESNVAKMTRKRTRNARNAADVPTQEEMETMDVGVPDASAPASSASSASSSSSSSSLPDPKQQRTFKGALRPKPTSRTNGPAKDPTLLPDRRRPVEADRVMTNEQVLLVNEEQAFYTQNLRKYGNLMDSMGISISRPGPPGGST